MCLCVCVYTFVCAGQSVTKKVFTYPCSPFNPFYTTTGLILYPWPDKVVTGNQTSPTHWVSVSFLSFLLSDWLTVTHVTRVMNISCLCASMWPVVSEFCRVHLWSVFSLCKRIEKWCGVYHFRGRRKGGDGAYIIAIVAHGGGRACRFTTACVIKVIICGMCAYLSCAPLLACGKLAS